MHVESFHANLSLDLQFNYGPGSRRAGLSESHQFVEVCGFCLQIRGPPEHKRSVVPTFRGLFLNQRKECHSSIGGNDTSTTELRAVEKQRGRSQFSLNPTCGVFRYHFKNDPLLKLKQISG